MLEEAKNAPKLASAIGIITGLVLLVTSFLSWPLCSKTKKEHFKEDEGVVDETEEGQEKAKNKKDAKIEEN